MTLTTKHILTISLEDDYDPEYPGFDFSIQCLNTHEIGSECNTWFECETCKRSIEKLMELGRQREIDELLDKATDGEIIHGERHATMEWTISTERSSCILYNNDSWESNVEDLGIDHGPGEYYIEFDCDGYDVNIFYVSKKGDPHD